jgi:oligoribonuclease (3'-5' exoribonuclease)
LGNHQDEKGHTALEYINKVNSEIKKGKYKGYENDLKLDETVLANSFRTFSGKGRRGAIEAAQDGCSIIKHQNQSKSASISTLPFGFLEGDTSSFSLKMNSTRSRSRSSSNNGSNPNSDSDSRGSNSDEEKDTVEILKCIHDVRKKILRSETVYDDQYSFLHDIVFTGLKRSREDEKKTNDKKRARKLYLNLKKNESRKNIIDKIEKYVKDICCPASGDDMQIDDLKLAENMHAIGKDFAYRTGYIVKTLKSYYYDVEKIEEDFDIVPAKDVWADIYNGER